MAKKWIAVFLVICIGLGAGVVYMREQSDRQAPEIICTDETAAEYNPGMSDAQLLKGIKAIDDKDGDVSDSLTVESVYEVDDSNVVVTYVAKDASNNIAKLKRNMSTDPEKMKESRENDDDTSEGTEPTPVPVEDVETGDSSPEESDSGEASADDGLTPTPTPAGDDIASQTAAEQEKMADDMPAQYPKIYLNEYYIKTSVGSSVDLLSNVKEIKDDTDNVSELWRRIQINGQVNTYTPGTYTCSYYVVDSAGNMSNTAELTVIVQ